MTAVPRVTASKRSAITNLAAQCAALTAVSVASLVVARADGAAVLGEYTLLRVLPWLLGVLVSCGLPIAAAYFLASASADDARLRPTLATMAAAGAAVAALLWLGLVVGIRRLFMPAVPIHVVALVSITVVTQLWTVTAKACCQGCNDIAGSNLVIVAEEAWFVLIYPTALILGADHTINTVVICMVISGSLATATGLLRLRQRSFFRGWGRPCPSVARGVARYGGVGQAGNLMWLMNLRFDLLLLGALSGPIVVGIYAVASKFAELMRLIPTALNYVLYPRFSSLGRVAAGVDARRLLGPATAVTVVATPVFAALAFVALPLLYGATFHSAVWPAEIIMVGLSVEGAAAVASAFLLGTRHPGLNAWGMAAGLVITVSLDIVMIPRYGALGGAITSCVAYLAATGVLTLLLRRLTCDVGRFRLPEPGEVDAPSR